MYGVVRERENNHSTLLVIFQLSEHISHTYLSYMYNDMTCVSIPDIINYYYKLMHTLGVCSMYIHARACYTYNGLL